MLVLASASPRRKEILQNAGVSFTVQAADIPEIAMPEETPRAFAERMAREKALVVFQKQPGRFVLGADTIVVVDQAILGKPRDAEDAVRMLRLLSGRQHEVITGVCLAGREFVDVRSEITQVFVDDVEESEIRDYVDTGEPMDKAGAYAIQGIASRWILKIEGNYANVVGLPITLVYEMLREHSVPLK